MSARHDTSVLYILFEGAVPFGLGNLFRSKGFVYSLLPAAQFTDLSVHKDLMVCKNLLVQKDLAICKGLCL